MKKILLLSVISAAISADTNFYDLVKSNDQNPKVIDGLKLSGEDYSNQNAEPTSAQQLLSLISALGNNSLAKSQELTDKNAKTSFLHGIYNKLKGFLGFDETSPPSQENILIKLKNLLQGQPNSTSQDLISQIPGKYQQLKNDNPDLINSLGDYLKNLFKNLNN
jgi:hypothetical protein